MANSAISISFELKDGANGIKMLTLNAADLRKVMSATAVEAGKLKTNFINFAAIATSFKVIGDAVNGIKGVMADLTGAYAVQEEAETKLQTVMRQRMGASDEEIQSIKDLASAQQELGVIGDEVQLSGAQQIATFLKEKTSLETLLPAMNNLLAQQKGLKATTGDAVTVGNLMGKAMMGQVDALKRVGITFTESEAQVMKFGNESQRAAMLAQIITNNVGNMNAELAKTDSGQIQQTVNWLGDLKEQLGSLMTGAMPFVSMAAQTTTVIANLGTLVTGLKGVTAAVISMTRSVIKSAAAQKLASAVTATWTAVQRVLNLVLSGNPIGLVIVAVGALVYGIREAYNNCEGFRRIVDAVWGAIKPLAEAIMNGLAKAFSWLAEKCKEAWEWLKSILGLGDKKVEVAVDVKKSEQTPAMDFGNIAVPQKSTVKAPKTPTEKAAPKGSIAALDQQIQAINTKISLEVDADSRAKLYAELTKLEDEKRELEFDYKFPTPPKAADIVPSIAPQIETDVKKINPQLEDVSAGLAQIGQKSQATKKDMAGAFKDLGSSISSLGSALELPVLDVAGTIAQAVATMALGYAQASSKSSALGPWGWIAFTAAGLAQLAAVITSIKSMTAFANGGIVSGPTVGLIGEYAGASNNPEVVAPLDRLRNLLSPVESVGIGGNVTFKIEGRTLVGVLARENKIRNRS